MVPRNIAPSPIPMPFSVNTLYPDCAIINDPAMLCDPLFIAALAVPFFFVLRDDELDLTGRSMITNSSRCLVRLRYRVWLEDFRALQVHLKGNCQSSRQSCGSLDQVP